MRPRERKSLRIRCEQYRRAGRHVDDDLGLICCAKTPWYGGVGEGHSGSAVSSNDAPRGLVEIFGTIPVELILPAKNRLLAINIFNPEKLKME